MPTPSSEVQESLWRIGWKFGGCVNTMFHVPQENGKSTEGNDPKTPYFFFFLVWNFLNVARGRGTAKEGILEVRNY